MREIKFRAWNSIDKCMCDNSTTLTNLRGFIKSKHYYPMEYTGLKDKNGVEIYEGDIVSGNSKVFGAVTGGVRLSEYLDNEEYMVEKHFGWNVAEIPLVDLINDGLTVIGNVHQNPELLEKQP